MDFSCVGKISKFRRQGPTGQKRLSMYTDVLSFSYARKIFIKFLYTETFLCRLRGENMVPHFLGACFLIFWCRKFLCSMQENDNGFYFGNFFMFFWLILRVCVYTICFSEIRKRERFLFWMFFCVIFFRFCVFACTILKVVRFWHTNIIYYCRFLEKNLLTDQTGCVILNA